MIFYEPLSTALHWQWFEERAHPILCADTSGILVVQDNGAIVAGAVYDSFTEASCNVHMVVEKPMVLRHGFLQAVAEDVFIRRNRKRIFGMTPTNNHRAIRFNEHIGMRKVAVIEDAFDDGIGYVITRMDRDTSPWLQHVREAA